MVITGQPVQANLENALATAEQLRGMRGNCQFPHPLALGDFNVPSVDWVKGSSTNLSGLNLIQLVTGMSWSLHVNESSRHRARHKHSLLDLMASTGITRYIRSR